MLAGLLTYYGFLSLFPLLLLMVTILGIAVGGHAALVKRIEHSALSQFPVIGGAGLAGHLQALHRNSGIALGVAIFGLVWGSQGIGSTGQFVMAQVWNIPEVARPGYLSRQARNLLTIATLGVFVLIGAALAGIAGFGGGQPIPRRIGGGLLSTAIDIGVYAVAFRVLTPGQIPTPQLLPGALFGGVAWSALGVAGTFLVDHELRNVSQVYGTFALVLGLLWWIYLVAQVTVYAAEINVVAARNLWPRSLVQPPLTEADRAVAEALAKQAIRHPKATVATEAATCAHDEPRSGRQSAPQARLRRRH